MGQRTHQSVSKSRRRMEGVNQNVYRRRERLEHLKRGVQPVELVHYRKEQKQLLNVRIQRAQPINLSESNSPRPRRMESVHQNVYPRREQLEHSGITMETLIVENVQNK